MFSVPWLVIEVMCLVVLYCQTNNCIQRPSSIRCQLTCHGHHFGPVVIQGSKDICSTAYLIMHSIIVLAEWLIDVLNPQSYDPVCQLLYITC